MTDNNYTIISTRVRLARNIKGYPFPHRLNEYPAKQIADSVEKALIGADNFKRYDVKEMSPVSGTLLQEKHLISADLLEESPYGVALINADETVSVMVNEEDHIREQVILSGYALDRAYGMANKLDDTLAGSVDFAFDKRYGYLTSCATNLGTGMRASVMMFLPALTLCNKMDRCINDVGRLNMTVRGVYGEGSDAEGYLYQISNQRSLGVTENDIIDSVKGAINLLSEREIAARDVLKHNESELKDKIFRAFGIATNAYKISTNEAIQNLALIRLGAYYGYLTVKNDWEFVKLFTDCQPANMQALGGEDMDADARDIFRAKFLSANLFQLIHNKR